jgi:glycosyltransferase involved in cell wall biosynthesis
MDVKTLSIVIPAFNEERRLPQTLSALNDWSRRSPAGIPYRLLEVIVVDDGSKDQTVAKSVEFIKDWPELRVQSLSKNQGKGAALRFGFLNARGEWVLLADADMSTPWTEVDKVFLRALAVNADMVMGSRAMAESDIRIRQSWLREHLGKTFNFILRGLTRVPFKDTQCGFKLVKNSPLTKEIFQNLSIQRFAYDVEIVLQLLSRKARVEEVAVVWEHKEESRVHPLKDGMEMLFSVLKFRLKTWLVMMLRQK